MKEKNHSYTSSILPVPRSKEQARRFYDRISSIYDCLTVVFERKYAELALEGLSIREGETVLEIGFGTGYCLKRIAESVGQMGKAYGVDISPGMLKVTKRRLEKAQQIDKVELYCGDAVNLPYSDNNFDAVFISFTLELFDTPEIPKLLKEVRRVLKPRGRIGAISMSKENGESLPLRLYEWAHMKWPKYFDCRPIYLEKALREAGYEIRERNKIKLCGLPFEIVIAYKS